MLIFRKISLLLLFRVLIISVLLFSCTKSRNYTFKCEDSIKSRRIIDTEFTGDCPAKCLLGPIWGTKSYTTDSSICKAAIHAGVIRPAGGRIKITIVPGQEKYEGSEQNGIQSNGWGAYDSGFIVSMP